MDGAHTLASLLSGLGAMLGQGKDAEPAPGQAQLSERPSGLYRFDGWQLDLASGQLIDAAGGEVALTKREAALLAIFLEAPGQLLMRGHLAAALQARLAADDNDGDPCVELEILGLRRKLEIDARFPEVILTDRGLDGVGYVFALDVERVST
ncbi:winged helix-turn-helix domain-containing protein [Bradyrhizobium sp. STM 3557]|uniref:winged helix-turn-helix domain-containing protein n=1 Tax=Bradyrhizobium sp. STM 3557 TaxID=578920 RepID=UPI003890354F